MAITITDIAKRVGVSHPVVSKVLNGGGATVGVSEQTRKNILEIANKMGYRPHGASQALRKRSFRSVGVLMGSASEFYLPQRMLAVLSQTLATHDYTCTLVCIKEFDADNLLASPLLKAHLVDVLLIGYVYEPPDSVTSVIERTRINSIWLNSFRDTDAVFVDEADAAAQLVKHLLECGHHQITYVDYAGQGENNPVTGYRLKGVRSSAEKLDVSVAYMIDKCVPRGQRVEASRKWLSRPNRSKAVIANSFASAQAIMQAAIELGMHIPDDLAIASFDNGRGYTIPEPPITSAIYPEEKFGRIAAEMALKKARNPNEHFRSYKLKYSLAVGGSTVRQKNNFGEI